jgi:multiple sugar transport system ATP-binding protein
VVLMLGEYAIKLTPEKAKAVEDGGYVGKPVVMGIRPEDLHDEEVYIAAGEANLIDADVEVTELLGAEVYLYLQIVGQPATARVNPRSTARTGDRIKMALDLSKVHVFDKETENIITN